MLKEIWKSVFGLSGYKPQKPPLFMKSYPKTKKQKKSHKKATGRARNDIYRYLSDENVRKLIKGKVISVNVAGKRICIKRRKEKINE